MNTHKLLLAFIDAMGYEVEWTTSYVDNSPANTDYKVTKKPDDDCITLPKIDVLCYGDFSHSLGDVVTVRPMAHYTLVADMGDKVKLKRITK